jgi:hypothetical protein
VSLQKKGTHRVDDRNQKKKGFWWRLESNQLNTTIRNQTLAVQVPPYDSPPWS